MFAQPLSDTPPIAISIQRKPERLAFEIKCSFNDKTEKEVQTVMETLQSEFNSLPRAKFKTSKIQEVSDIFSKSLNFEAKMDLYSYKSSREDFQNLTDSSITQLVQNCLFDEYYTLESVSNIESGKNNRSGALLLIFKGPS